MGLVAVVIWVVVFLFYNMVLFQVTSALNCYSILLLSNSTTIYIHVLFVEKCVPVHAYCQNDIPTLLVVVAMVATITVSLLALSPGFFP